MGTNLSPDDLAAMMARLSALENHIQSREAQFHARESELLGQISVLAASQAAPRAAADADGWIGDSPMQQSGAAPTSSATEVPSTPDPRSRVTDASSVPPAVSVPPTSTATSTASSPSPKSSSSKGKGKSKPAKKKVSEVHRITKAELPEDVTGVRDAFYLHIRILWNLVVTTAIPVLPTAAFLAWFGRNFTSIGAVMAARDGPQQISPSLVEIARVGLGTAKRGTHRQKANRVEETALSFISAFMARFGFSRWAPDLSATPYNLYNSACRIIAILSFQQAVLAHAYAHFAPVVEYVQDMGLLIKLYDHFVHHFQYRRWFKDGLEPGVILVKELLRIIYQRRTRLKDARIRQLQRRGLTRYCGLLQDAKAHSDDELDPETGNYIIHEKPGRSARVTALIRTLDSEREAEARALGQNPGRKRVPPSEPRPAQLPALPRKVTVDWFDVNFFNSLSVHVRRKVGNRGIALHDEDKFVLCNPPHKFERMGMSQFMEEVGDVVLSQYDIPDKKEKDAVASDDDQWLHDDDDGEDGDDEMDTMDDETAMGLVTEALNAEQLLFRNSVAQ